ncbi:MAG: sugar phosphate isomerase/epimerase, partial [Armatimonadota bacterium]|nr:sugar phosphate isomerase/epimerase [Armatimonadota bacterium]
MRCKTREPLVRCTLARAAFAALLLAVLALGCAPQASAARDDAAAERLGWRLGPQAYTFRNYTLFEAIEKTQALGMKVIEIYPGQKLRPGSDTRSGLEMSAEEVEALKKKLADAGVRPVCFGVIAIPSEEAAARRLFQFARDLGIETITSEPNPEALEAIDRLCGEYGVNVAIHNHPRPSRYWDPDVLLAALKGRSRRIGACADIGHWMRSGVNPLEALRKLEGRIISFHFKDLNEFGVRDAHDVPWGTGVGETRALLSEIRRQGFSG